MGHKDALKLWLAPGVKEGLYCGAPWGSIYPSLVNVLFSFISPFLCQNRGNHFPSPQLFKVPVLKPREGVGVCSVSPVFDKLWIWPAIQMIQSFHLICDALVFKYRAFGLYFAIKMHVVMIHTLKMVSGGTKPQWNASECPTQHK